MLDIVTMRNCGGRGNELEIRACPQVFYKPKIALNNKPVTFLRYFDFNAFLARAEGIV